jgi:hypothetical protein
MTPFFLIDTSLEIKLALFMLSINYFQLNKLKKYGHCLHFLFYFQSCMDV